MVIIFLILFGLCLGSFVNALVWRLHEQSQTKGKKKMRELSISKGRSQCPHCGYVLAAKDLVPVFSWLSLGGKCRYCKKPISRQYPVVELLGASMLVVSYIWWPYASQWDILESVIFAVWALIVTGFLALAVYDARWYLLPDKIVYPLTVLGAVFVGLLAASHNDTAVIRDAAIGAFVIFALFYSIYQFSGGKWIGGGDVKLAILLGALAGGLLKAMLLLFFASVLGTFYGVLLSTAGGQKLNHKLRIPFGPFLIVAVIIVVLFGTDITNWYSDLILSV